MGCGNQYTNSNIHNVWKNISEYSFRYRLGQPAENMRKKPVGDYYYYCMCKYLDTFNPLTTHRSSSSSHSLHLAIKMETRLCAMCIRYSKYIDEASAHTELEIYVNVFVDHYLCIRTFCVVQRLFLLSILKIKLNGRWI